MGVFCWVGHPPPRRGPFSRTAQCSALYSTSWVDALRSAGIDVNLVQFEIPGTGRRVGILDGRIVQDVTARRSELRFLVDVFEAAFAANQSLEVFLRSVLASGAGGATLDWE